MQRFAIFLLNFAVVGAAALLVPGCGASPSGPSGGGTTTIPATTTSSSSTTSTSTTSTTSTSTTSTSVPTTSTTSTTSTTTSIPIFTPFYGVYNVSFKTVLNENCPLPDKDSGTLTLLGQPNGDEFFAEVRQPQIGLLRRYRGTIMLDGSFSATGDGVTPGSVRPTGDPSPNHEFIGTISGKVIGNTISATESLTITAGCTGRPKVIYELAGSK